MPMVFAWNQAAYVPVPFSRRFKLHSHHVGADFIIDIAMPAPYLAGEKPSPVLFVTDGNLSFPTAAVTMGILPVEPGGPRPACVVGIGYELAGEGEQGEHLVLRNRDLTPRRVEEWESRMQAAPPPFHLGDTVRTGGGDRFLDFILDELKPWLAANFPIDTGDCTLAGSSFGGTLSTPCSPGLVPSEAIWRSAQRCGGRSIIWLSWKRALLAAMPISTGRSTCALAARRKYRRRRPGWSVRSGSLRQPLRRALIPPCGWRMKSCRARLM